MYTICLFFQQPVVWDTAYYIELSKDHFKWAYGFPYLENQGIRSYAYTWIINLLGGKIGVKIFQIIFLSTLLTILSRYFKANSMLETIALISMILAVPILPIYSEVLLADILGTILLQSYFLLMTISTINYQHIKICIAGMLLGLCVQVRPSFFYLIWPMLCIISIFQISNINIYKIKLSLFTKFQKVSLILLSFIFGWIILGIPTMTGNIIKTNYISFMPPSDNLIAYHMIIGMHLDYWSSNPPPIDKLKLAKQKLSEDGTLSNTSPPQEAIRYMAKTPIKWIWQSIKHVYYAFQKSEIFPYKPVPLKIFGIFVYVANWIILSGFTTGVIITLISNKSNDCIWQFALFQALLITYLVVTLALVIPEERHTMPIYITSPFFSLMVLRYFSKTKFKELELNLLARLSLPLSKNVT